MTTPNPFINPIYNIYESSLNTNCFSSNTSRILKSTYPGPAYSTTKNGPMNLFNIQKYISDELEYFLDMVHLVKRCDDLALISNKTIPDKCSNTFNNFNHHYNNSLLNSNSTIFNNIEYNNTYVNSQTDNNKKKNLCQKYNDIKQMLDDFQTILTEINTDENINDYPDDYNLIMKKYSNNMVLRNELNGKIDELYSDKHSKFGNSKLHLDSTVYTSVLWTILATTIIFYIFKKL